MDTTAAYNYLINLQIFRAVFTLYDTLLLHWFAPLLFITFQILLLIKTKNITLSWVTGIIMCSMYASTYIVQAVSTQILIILLVIELAGILFMVFLK